MIITSFVEKQKSVISITISMAVETLTAKMWQEKVTESVLPVVVNFSAVRCGFCQALEPLYNRLSEQYKDKLVFLKLMVDDQKNQELLDRISIEGTPTLKFYCKNREIGNILDMQ